MSVNWINPVELDKDRLNVPGNNDSLYLALSTDITQKSSDTSVLVPSPKVKVAFSSSNINDLYCP